MERDKVGEDLFIKHGYCNSTMFVVTFTLKENNYLYLQFD